ncbi:unnamed protein product [Paramecium octaurelia]|uniref:Uncharacterized protein n=1 Tax=Paramecium octaurelia TaxID=43137 RepID=A0A8S1WCT4_PAROT|nr:unnamed protein product [Paramecium octaurelia]
MKSRELETKNETKDHLLIFCSDPIAGLGLQLSSLQRSLLYIISSAIYASKTNTNSRTFYQNHRLITQIQMTHQGVSHYNYKLIQNIQCSSQRTPVGSRVRHPLNHPALLTPGNQLFKNVKQTNTKNELIHIYDAKLNRKIQSNPQIKIISQLSEIIDLLMVIPAQFFDSQIRGWYLHRVFPSPYRRNTNGFPKLPTAGIRISIRLWDVKTGQQKAKLDGHSNQVRTICYSPDGTTLVSCSADNSIRLWDVKTGQQKAILDGHSSTVYSVNFSPDGNTLASGSDDNSIRLWDVKTSKEILQSNGSYKDLLAQFNIPLQNSSQLPNVNPYCTILRICSNPLFQASGTLILKGQFMNYQGIDLKPLFKSKGSCFLEDLKQNKLKAFQFSFKSFSYYLFEQYVFFVSILDLNFLRQIITYFQIVFHFQQVIKPFYLYAIQIFGKY